MGRGQYFNLIMLGARHRRAGDLPDQAAEAAGHQALSRQRDGTGARDRLPGAVPLSARHPDELDAHQHRADARGPGRGGGGAGPAALKASREARARYGDPRHAGRSWPTGPERTFPRRPPRLHGCHVPVTASSPMAPRTLYDKIWDDHVVDAPAGRHLPALHRPPPRPRGDQPAGLRGPAHDRPQGARAAEDARRGRPQRAHDRPLARHRGPGVAASRSRRWPRTPRDFGIEYYNELDTRQGIVHVIGPGAGLHPAGHDDRLRRQPHLDARRLRRARVRHRHQRGRARARHADADPEEGEEHAHHGRRQAAAPA